MCECASARAAKVWITLIIKRDHIEVMHEQFFISAFYWRALLGLVQRRELAREFIALCCVIKLNSPLPGAAITAIRSLRR
jgi:hypothetical protein